MKTILCPTDFTPNAENAVNTAAYIASKLKTNLFLFNTCITTPAIVAYSGGPWVVDEIMERQNQSQLKLNILKTHLTDTIAKLGRDDYHPAIHAECGEGRLGINVDEIIKTRNVEMVVMGAKSGHRHNNFLNGSEITDVINHSTRPIVIIPENIHLKALKNVMFATDFNEEDLDALAYLSQLGLRLQFHIELVHVKIDNAKPNVPFEKKIFLDRIFNAGYSNVSFKEVNGKDLIRRLMTFSEQSKIDMLAMMHKQHGFFIRLFERSVTKDILTNQLIPMMIFPSSMTN